MKICWMEVFRVERLYRILISPREIFDEIREKPSILMPLICILIFGGFWAAVETYNVDEGVYALEAKAQSQMSQLFSTLLEGDLEGLDEQSQELEELNELILEGEDVDVEALGVTSEDIARVRTNATVFAPFMFALGTGIVLLLIGTYYFIAAKVVNVEIGWDKWFAFACWAALPYVIGYIARVVLVSFGGADSSNLLDPLTWFGFEEGWAKFLSIPLFWSFFVAIHGFQSWTGKDAKTSTVVVVLPAALAVVFLFVVGGLTESLVQAVN